jgi:hypothetical protein
MLNNRASNHEYWAFAALAALMAATRFHHTGTEFALPDASLAVFFLAGIYWNSLASFAGLLALALLVDLAAVGFGGFGAYCLSPAYGFLALSYGAMNLAGRWAGGAGHRQSLLTRSAIAIPAATALAYLISSYSFYLFSGKVSGVDWLAYGKGIAADFPEYLGAAFVYSAAALGLDAGLRALGSDLRRQQPAD